MRPGFAWTRHSRWWLLLSAALTALSIASLAVRGLNYTIDFTGGIVMDLAFEQPTTVTEIRQVLDAQGLGGSVVKELGQEHREFTVQTVDLTEAQRMGLLAALRERLGPFETRSLDKVSPVIGAELRRAALLAVVLATLGMLAYIALRFEWRYGVAAILALVHDVLLTTGFFSLFQLPVDLSFVAAILTVYGYSINDTIIVFDRIRENIRHRRKLGLAAVVDQSINGVLARSINTSLTTLLAISAVLVFGGSTTRPLALALVVGIALGTYSSICLASPLFVWIAEGRLGGVPQQQAALKS